MRRTISGFTSALLAVVALASAGLAAELPLGLWVWTAEAETAVLDVAVEREGGSWLATADGDPVSIEVRERQVAIGGHAEGRGFAGELSEDGATIRGLWRQPSGPLAYADMATPSVLAAVHEGRWKGRVALQPRLFRVFLDVFENEDGDLAAVVRNPERNEIMASRFDMEPDGDGRWMLSAGRGERRVRRSLEETKTGLRLAHSWFGAPLMLRRAGPEDAAFYYPRDPAAGPARYAPPPGLDDGWTVAAAEEAGFDRQALDDLVAELAADDPRNARPRLIHSVLAAHKGRLVLEEYFYGYDRETRHDTRSLAKVFAPVLVGALQQRGVAIAADDRPIPELLAAAGETIDDPRKEKITLAHLMSFSSGLDCDVVRNSPGSEDRMWSQRAESDFWLYTARLPLLHDPGTRYAYCSGSINLVGSRLKAAGGAPILDLFDDLIARPLQFGPYHWNLAPNGAAYLGGGAYMRPRDILKVGAMFAAGGRWKGAQIVDPDWVEKSTTAVIDITPQTTGLSPEDFNNNYFGGSAAYEWRIDEVRAGEKTYASYEATGNGGQILLVVPDLELVVLFTGGNYRQGGVWGRWRNEIVGGHIIPAMTSGR
ncbi:MAG: serine hydrolase domain-containing protein [Pseudomonadota bacterium]